MGDLVDFTKRPMRLQEQRDATLPVENPAQHAAEIELAKQMAEILQKMYPSHQWATCADFRGGLLMIAIPSLMGQITWHVQHYSRITTYPELTNWLKNAGGEILERFRMKRGEFEIGSFMDARKMRITRNGQDLPV